MNKLRKLLIVTISYFIAIGLLTASLSITLPFVIVLLFVGAGSLLISVGTNFKYFLTDHFTQGEKVFRSNIQGLIVFLTIATYFLSFIYSNIEANQEKAVSASISFLIINALAYTAGVVLYLHSMRKK